jgi:hypothetical protein
VATSVRIPMTEMITINSSRVNPEHRERGMLFIAGSL